MGDTERLDLCGQQHQNHTENSDLKKETKYLKFPKKLEGSKIFFLMGRHPKILFTVGWLTVGCSSGKKNH